MIDETTRLFQTQHILHVVDAGLLGGDPLGGTDRTTGKHVARHGAVRDLDPLALADEVDGMLADDVAAANRLHADLFLGALAADALAVVVGDLVVVAPQRFGHHFTHAHGRAGG